MKSFSIGLLLACQWLPVMPGIRFENKSANYFVLLTGFKQTAGYKQAL
jgi:hypothetical protein